MFETLQTTDALPVNHTETEVLSSPKTLSPAHVISIWSTFTALLMGTDGGWWRRGGGLIPAGTKKT